MTDTEAARNPSLSPEVRDQIAGIVRQFQVFYPPEDPILGKTDGDVVAPSLDVLLCDPEATVAYLDEGEEVTGFSLAIPIGRMDKARQNESQDTAYIYYTAVKATWQGQGLAGPLLEKLYAQLKQGGYRYIERDSVLDGGWADKVEKNHQSAVIDSYEHDRWGLGPERFFRMDLEKLGVERQD